MYKTVSTAPYLAALVASNSIGLELVSDTQTGRALSPQQTPRTQASTDPQQHVAQSRLRKLSNAASNLYAPRSLSTRERETSPSNTNKNNNHNHTASDRSPSNDTEASNWGPFFTQTVRRRDIRRLYPSKAPGRAHLAPVDPNRTNARSFHSRKSSHSSAASVLPTPSPIATMKTFFGEEEDTGKKSSDDDRCVSPVAHSRREAHLGHSKRDLLVEASGDTTYGTMSREDLLLYDGAVAAAATPSPYKHVREPGEAPPLRAIDGTSSLGFFESPPAWLNRGATKPTGAFVKGHARDDSIASIWTVDSSSSEEDGSPPLNRLKPLQSHVRLPLPQFKENSIPKIPLVNSQEHSSTTSRPQSCMPFGMSLGTTERPPIPPRTSSRKSSDQSKSSNQSSRRASLPIPRQMLKPTTTRASESWDDDFGELSLDVPQSIRESQATVHTHLSQIRQFSTLVDALRSLRSSSLSDTHQHGAQTSPTIDRLRRETDALIAIADHGAESGPLNAAPEPDHETDTMSRLLGRKNGDRRKVKLDGTSLARLIVEAERLVHEMRSATATKKDTKDTMTEGTERSRELCL